MSANHSPVTSSQATTAAPISSSQSDNRMGERLAPFLFLIALCGEVLSMLLMTMLRYGNQGMEAELFAFSKTANLYGFLLALPFILLFSVLIFLRRFRSPGLAGSAAAMSCVGVVALTSAPLLTPDSRIYLYVGYLAYKAIELSIFTVLLRRPSISFWRKIPRIAILALTIMVGGFLLVISSVLLSPVGSAILDQPRQEFDAAVILGAAVWSGDKPSPVLRERINKGYDLLKNGTVQFLVLTGGSAPNELPEAEVAKRELLKRGVDPTRIVLERQTSSTVEQIVFIRDQLLKQGWTSFIIVSDQFHLKRALEICDFNNINAHGVSSESPLGPQNLALYHLRESVALVLYWMFGA